MKVVFTLLYEGWVVKHCEKIHIFFWKTCTSISHIALLSHISLKHKFYLNKIHQPVFLELLVHLQSYCRG